MFEPDWTNLILSILYLRVLPLNFGGLMESKKSNGGPFIQNLKSLTQKTKKSGQLSYFQKVWKILHIIETSFFFFTIFQKFHGLLLFSMNSEQETFFLCMFHGWDRGTPRSFRTLCDWYTYLYQGVILIMYTPTPWLTRLLVLGKSCVNQKLC